MQNTGELEHLPSRKQSSILWKGSAVELQSNSVHYQRLKTCPDRLHWCCVLSIATFLPPLVSFCRQKKRYHAAVAFAPFLLILLKSGPTDDETFLPFSGSLWKRFLIFKEEEKSHLRFVAFADPHITYPEMKTKGTTTSTKKINTTYCILLHRRMRWGRSGMWAPGFSRRREVLRSFRLTPEPKYNQHIGLFPLSSAWWRSSNSPLVKHKVSVSERGTPTVISLAAIPVASKGDAMARKTKLRNKSRQINNLKCVYSPRTTYLSS